MIDDVHSSRRLDQRSGQNADQTEYASVLHGSAVVDSGIYDDRIAGSLDDFAPDGVSAIGEAWHERDVESDSAVGRIREELERRARIMGTAYPFKLERGTLTYASSKSKIYEFCLATSCAESITTGEFVQLPRSFERVTAEIVRLYLGVNALTAHTGEPRDKKSGQKFKDAMDVLSKACGEWVWGPEEGLPPDGGDEKDGGVDFVAWKKAPDNRKVQLFVIGQCACGDNWDQKFHDLNLERLRKWFRPMIWAMPPVRAFATPHHLVDGHLYAAAKEAGLIFDRARLSILAEENSADPALAAWRPRLDQLTAMIIRPVGGAVKAAEGAAPHKPSRSHKRRSPRTESPAGRRIISSK